MREWKKRDIVSMAVGDAMSRPGSEYTREKPARVAELVGDVIVPALKSLITGVALMFVVIGVARAAFDEADVWGVGAAGLIIGFGATWYWLLRDHQRQLYEREVVRRVDINGDGVIGDSRDQEPPPPTITTVEFIDKERGNMRYIDLPVNDFEIAAMAKALLIDDVGFSRRQLKSVSAIVGEQYSAILQKFEVEGFVRCCGATANAGYELTSKGKAVLSRFLSEADLRSWREKEARPVLVDGRSVVLAYAENGD